MCDLDVMGVPSKLSVIRKGESLARSRPTLDLICEENVVRRYFRWFIKIRIRTTPEFFTPSKEITDVPPIMYQSLSLTLKNGKKGFLVFETKRILCVFKVLRVPKIDYIISPPKFRV